MPLLATLALGACGGIGPAAQAPPAGHECSRAAGTSPVRVLHPRLAARICVLEARSPRFRAAMASLHAGDLPILIGTPKQIATNERRAARLGTDLPPKRLADFTMLLDPQTGELAALVVRVEISRLAPLLRAWARDNPRWRGTPDELDEMLDGILIHEVWGHLLPVAAARGAGGQCHDPRPRQPELESCVMRRENDLRQELGMRVRTRYALSRWDR